MPATQTITEEQRDDVLEDSIHRRLRAMLTLRLPEGWRTYQSGFRSGTRFSRTIQLGAMVPKSTPAALLPRPGELVGVTFRLGHKKCMFSAVVQTVTRQDAALLVTMNWPDRLEQLQRRAYERVAPPKGTVVGVRFWRDEPNADTPDGPRNVRHGQLENLSAGGMCIKTADLSDMEVGGAYRCVFAPQPGAPTVIVDAILRHREATDHGRASLGFHFLGLEATPEGRKLLERITRTVIKFQRARRRGRRSSDTHDGE